MSEQLDEHVMTQRLVVVRRDRVSVDHVVVVVVTCWRHCGGTVVTADTVHSQPVHQLASRVLRPLLQLTARRRRGAVAVDGSDQTVEERRRNDGWKHCSVCHLRLNTTVTDLSTRLYCGSKKPDPSCYIFKPLQQILVNISNFWYSESIKSSVFR